MKPLLTSDALIAHMEEKGIGFQIETKEEAKNFLEKHNYYMKLASYRANYKKYPSGKNAGKYIALEFSYLRELSTIDMRLRYIVLQMSLDIEHFLKVRLLKAVEDNPNDDGYRIVKDFLGQDQSLNSLKKIYRHKASGYCKNLIEKYHPYYPVWVFVELISFGELAYLCDFYNKKYDECLADNILLNSVRDIRNAAAHSNCLINYLLPGNNNPHGSVVNLVKGVNGIGKNTRDKKLSNKFLYDFTCLMFAYEQIITSQETKRKRMEELQALFGVRMLRHKDWFEKNDAIVSAYHFSKKILDNFN